MVVGQLIAILALDSKPLKKDLKSVEAEADKAGSKIGNIFKNAFSVTLGIGMFEALKKGIKSTVGASVDFNSMLQTAQIGFSTMLGSAEKAQKFLDGMADFAARTPFGYEDLLESSKRMLAYGFAAENVLPTLRAVGDATAALGMGSEGIDRVTLALGQILAKGKLSGEEMRQLTEAGIPAWNMLADAMGTTVPELQKMVSKGLVPGHKAVIMLTNGMTQRFGGMMASMEDTWQGVTSSIKDIWQMTVGTLTSTLFGGLNTMLIKVRDFMAEFYNYLQGIFGKKAKQSTDVFTDSTKAQTTAMTDLGDATEEAAKKANKNLQSFDEVHQLQEDMSDTAIGGLSIPGAGVSAMSLGETDDSAFQPISDGLSNIITKAQQAWQYMQNAFGPSIQAALDSIVPKLAVWKETLSQTFSNIGTLATPLKNWLINDLIPFWQQKIMLLGNIFGGLLDSGNLVFEGLKNAAMPVLDWFVSNGLPLITDFSSGCLDVFKALFDSVKNIFDTLWEEGVSPGLNLLSDMTIDALDSLKKFWDDWGDKIVQGFEDMLNNIEETLTKLWESTLKPIWDKILETVNWLWEEHLKGLVDQVLEFVGKLVTGAQDIYNKFISPIVNWFIETFGPVISNAFQLVIDVLGTVIAVISDVAKGIFRSLGGIIDFIVGIFTGDWEKAWEGVKNIFGGIFDSLYGLVKAPLNLIIDALNFVIRGLNSISISVPNWVADLLGMERGSKFGFSISEIQKLETGTNYVPQDMLAYIHEGEAVVPKKYNPEAGGGLTAESIEQAVYRAFTNALRIMQTSARQDDRVLVLKIDNTVLARLQLPALQREAERQGFGLILRPQGV